MQTAMMIVLLLLACCRASPAEFDFDVFVIGGGSGGIACAKEAARLGARVGLCDAVRPSPRGSSWGLGGTCVNVGCIPKKLMHRAAHLRRVVEVDAPAYGYDVTAALEGASSGLSHEWSSLVEAVQDHVHALNFGYRTALSKAGVVHHNSHGALRGGHEVTLRDAKGRDSVVRARHIVLAVGGRPRYPAEFEGADAVALSSDDLFSLRSPPGKTLVVGAGYVALECAGFLASLGYPTTVLVRSVPLRGFDEQCAELVLRALEDEGARVRRRAVPLRASRLPSGRLLVTWRREVSPGEIARAAADAEVAPADAGSAGLLEEVTEEFDNVLVATGRQADTAGLNLEAVGLAARPDGKLETKQETTAVPYVHAIGDVASESPANRPELTPVAARAGVLLARRLFGEGPSEALESGGAHRRLGPAAVPTAVFTPLEYACVGLSEEEAAARYGEDDLEVYHTHYTPLEWAPTSRPTNKCYVKVLCQKSDEERLVGLHLVGEHAAEIMQVRRRALTLRGARRRC